MTTMTIEFASGDGRCAGVLYPAADEQRRPCVVLCTGFGGTQDTPSIVAAAETFARHGYTALTFDYRNFGRSSGQPRQLIDLQGQLADIHAAVAFARRRREVDPERIVLWGTSLGGGHVVTAAAADPRLAAVIAQIPFNGFPRRVEGRTMRETVRLLAAMVYDRIRGWLSLPPYYIPAVGVPGELAVMASIDAEQAIAGMDSPTWRNEAAPRALIDMMRYRPGDAAPRLQMPVLVSLAQYDREAPEAHVEALASAAPKGVLQRYPAKHFEFYRPDLRERVLADQIAFLDDVLAAEKP